MIQIGVVIKYRKHSYSGNCINSKVGTILYDPDTYAMFIDIPLCDKEFEFVKEKVIEFLSDPEMENMTVFNSTILKEQDIVIQVSM